MDVCLLLSLLSVALGGCTSRACRTQKKLPRLSGSSTQFKKGNAMKTANGFALALLLMSGAANATRYDLRGLEFARDETLAGNNEAVGFVDIVNGSIRGWDITLTWPNDGGWRFLPCSQQVGDAPCRDIAAQESPTQYYFLHGSSPDTSASLYLTFRQPLEPNGALLDLAQSYSHNQWIQRDAIAGGFVVPEPSTFLVLLASLPLIARRLRHGFGI